MAISVAGGHGGGDDGGRDDGGGDDGGDDGRSPSCRQRGMSGVECSRGQ